MSHLITYMNAWEGLRILLPPGRPRWPARAALAPGVRDSAAARVRILAA
ncbi:hypothetical protein [Kitasatospora sp. KL5]